MTKKEDMLVQEFYSNAKQYLIPIKESTGNESSLQDYLWDDYKSLSEFVRTKDNEDLFFYTIVTGDEDTAWIVKGCKYANRVGYLITSEDIKGFPEDGIRYW